MDTNIIAYESSVAMGHTPLPNHPMSTTAIEVPFGVTGARPHWTDLTSHSPLPPIHNHDVKSTMEPSKIPHAKLGADVRQDPHGEHHHPFSHVNPGALAKRDDALNGQLGVAEPLLVSLRVCTQCQESLLGAFDHCLSRHGAAQLDSVHQIDEVADAQPLTEPPVFTVIKDPTVKQNTLYDEFSQKVERDRTVFFQTRMQEGAQVGKKRVHGVSFGQPRFFSGALYKRTIEAKDREIKMLREKIYDRTMAERREHNNVEKLKVALDKSMKYYMHAEEWQMNESKRLQQDVRYLKAELSSLMAFLINSEEDKRVLLDQIDEAKKECAKKDELVAEMEGQKAQLKVKLHESFKEYLTMSETIAKLKKEAEHGSDTIISRNEILQRNLDKLSRDFERTSQELSASQTKIRELEFELEEIVVQFNITGEAKRTAEDMNVRLTTELDHISENHRTLITTHDSLMVKAQRLESDLSSITLVQQTTKKELETKTDTLAKDLEAALAAKKDVEGSLKFAKSEIEKLSSALKSLTRSKDQIESSFKTAAQKHDKDIALREDKISDLINLRAEDARAMKKLQELKEQLMFQVTDLQNNLDRELANVNILTFELAQVKRTGEERTTNLEEQVEKLNAAKVNLANDKRQLTDKIRLIRADLKRKEEEYEFLDKSFEAHKAASSTTEAQLRKELAELQSDHLTLRSQHQTLEQKQVLLIETNVDLAMKQEALKKRQAHLEEMDAKTQAEIEEVKRVNQTLSSSNAVAISEHNEMKIHLDSVLGKIEELKQILAQERSEAAVTIKEKSELIVKLTADLYQSQGEEKRLDTLCTGLQLTCDRLETELAEVKAALAAEVINKDHFEVHCYELRRTLNEERRLRLELERMQSRIDKRTAERVLERIESMRLRDHKFSDLAKTLKAEHTRLKNVSTLLPTEEAFVAIEAPEIPSFLQTNGFSQTRPVRAAAQPDMRVTVTKIGGHQ